MVFLLSLLACTGHDDSDATAEGPSITFLAPENGATVSAGAVDVTLVVENFTLVSPVKHNDDAETPEGYIALSYTDGGSTLTETTGSTQASITLNEVGEHTLTAELLYEDGDALEPAVSAEVTVTVTGPG